MGAKKQIERDNQWASISRGAAGGAAVGVGAGVAYLIKPDLFKFKGVGIDGGLMTDRALEGATYYRVTTPTVDGVEGRTKVRKLTGLVSEERLAGVLKAGNKLADGNSLEFVKHVAPMRRSAVFSNRAAVAALGGIATIAVADRVVGSRKDKGWVDKALHGGGAAVAGAAVSTAGAVAIGKLTHRSIAKGGLLAQNQALYKPNTEWVKRMYGIASITAIPAGASAATYFNVFDDFDEITSTRSPFRK